MANGPYDFGVPGAKKKQPGYLAAGGAGGGTTGVGVNAAGGGTTGVGVQASTGGINDYASSQIAEAAQRRKRIGGAYKDFGLAGAVGQIGSEFSGRARALGQGLSNYAKSAGRTGAEFLYGPKGSAAILGAPAAPAQQGAQQPTGIDQQAFLQDQMGSGDLALTQPGSQQDRMLQEQQLLPEGVERQGRPGIYEYSTEGLGPGPRAEFGKAIYSDSPEGATPGGFRADIAKYGQTQRDFAGPSPVYESTLPLESRVALGSGGLGDAVRAEAAYSSGQLGEGQAALDEYTRLHRAGIDAEKGESQQRSYARQEKDLQRRLTAQIKEPPSADQLQKIEREVYEATASRAAEQGFSGPAVVTLGNQAVKNVLGALAAAGESQQRTGRRAGEALGGIARARAASGAAEAAYLREDQSKEAQFLREQQLISLKAILDRQGEQEKGQREALGGIATDPLMTPEKAEAASAEVRRIYGTGGEETTRYGPGNQRSASEFIASMKKRGATDEEALALARGDINKGLLNDDLGGA